MFQTLISVISLTLRLTCRAIFSYVLFGITSLRTTELYITANSLLKYYSLRPIKLWNVLQWTFWNLFVFQTVPNLTFIMYF